MLAIGTPAPAFSLPDQNGTIHNLEQYKGKKIILYFYPKDNTAGCTKQACGFSERYPQIMEQGAVVIGVNKDSVTSHKKFEEKYGLAFPLLSDPELEVIQAYDVWHEKKMAAVLKLNDEKLKELVARASEFGIVEGANFNCPGQIVISGENKAIDEAVKIAKELGG